MFYWGSISKAKEYRRNLESTTERMLSGDAAHLLLLEREQEVNAQRRV